MHPAAGDAADFAEQGCVDSLRFRLLRFSIEPGVRQNQLGVPGNDVVEPALVGGNARLIMPWRGLLERERARRGPLRLH